MHGKLSPSWGSHNKLDITIVEKVMKWLEYRNVSEVRKFLRIAGIVRNWIKGFAEIVDPLTKLRVRVRG